MKQFSYYLSKLNLAGHKICQLHYHYMLSGFIVCTPKYAFREWHVYFYLPTSNAPIDLSIFRGSDPNRKDEGVSKNVIGLEFRMNH